MMQTARIPPRWSARMQSPPAAPQLREADTALGVAAWLVGRWKGYWFGPGFSLSYAVCRVAMALAFLHMEQRIFPPDYASYLAAQNPQLYQPIGILYLVSPDAPDPAFCMACKLALRVS